jgi:hypothetical protein
MEKTRQCLSTARGINLLAPGAGRTGHLEVYIYQRGRLFVENV